MAVGKDEFLSCRKSDRNVQGTNHVCFFCPRSVATAFLMMIMAALMEGLSCQPPYTGDIIHLVLNLKKSRFRVVR